MPIGNFATVTKNLLMGFFDNKPFLIIFAHRTLNVG